MLKSGISKMQILSERVTLYDYELIVGDHMGKDYWHLVYMQAELVLLTSYMDWDRVSCSCCYSNMFFLKH